MSLSVTIIAFKIFGRLSKKAGVKGRFDPHSIRHLVGQYWTDETNLALAQVKLGHRDMSTTGRFYAHQDRARIKEWTKRLTLLGRDSAARHA